MGGVIREGSREYEKLMHRFPLTRHEATKTHRIVSSPIVRGAGEVQNLIKPENGQKSPGSSRLIFAKNDKTLGDTGFGGQRW